jgi:ribosomal protein L29
MKKKELEGLRNKKIDELKKLVDKKRQEKLLVYSKMKAGQEKNLKKVKNLRCDIAQILTIIREKELMEQGK